VLSFSAGANDGPVKLQNGPTLPEVWRTTPFGTPEYVSEDPDGRYLYVYSRSGLLRLNAETGAEEQRVTGILKEGMVMCMKKRRFLVWGPIHPDTAYIDVYQYPEATRLRRIPMPNGGGGMSGWRVVMSDDEEYMAASGKDGAYVWLMETGEHVWTLPRSDQGQVAGYPFVSCWTRDSTRLIISQSIGARYSREILCWDVLENRRVWKRIAGTPNDNPTFGASITEDGKRIIFHTSEQLDVHEFPSMDLVYSHWNVQPKVLASSNGEYLIVGPRRHPTDGLISNRNLSLIRPDTKAEVVLDTQAFYPRFWKNGFLYVASAIPPGNLLLHKLRFDWATSVQEEPAPAVLTITPNPCPESGLVR
jgi:hypothetical protein